MEEKQIKKSNVKILVVDDREDNLFSIETILEKDGYMLVKASSGRAALKILLQDQDFTLILMDVQMPNLNGLETAALIYERDKLKHVPIIFITANNYDEQFIFQGYQTGGVDYIYKPINPELLRLKVGIFVELYRKTHELLQQEKSLIAANMRLEREIEERRISEEKVRLLNQQLIEKNAHLKSTVEELDRFAYVASHDLQEPLRKITFFSDRISKKYMGTISGDLDNDLQKIIRASERMNLLINDLLQFSRQSAEAKDFTYVNLEEIVREVISDLEVHIDKAHASIEVRSLPVIWGVPSQLRQLFQNLISNAIKFCKKDAAPQVVIYAEKTKSFGVDRTSEQIKERFYEIHVKDNGIGFDQQYAEDIFVIFKRLHSYHDFEGTGVGLSICKKIVENHKGMIRAESKPNEGAVFSFCIPEKIVREAPVKDLRQLGLTS
jgi:hypothetical protein